MWRLAVIAAVLCGGSLLSAQTGASQWASDYELKAAFVYNIVPFVDWPQGAIGDRVVIGFAGEGPMASVMMKFFAGKRVGARPIEVRVVHTRDELRTCNIVLLAYPDRSRVQEALTHLRDTNILTIGDGEQFTKLGGVISFVPRGNTFQLAINPQAAARTHLRISSKLISIAMLVSDDETAMRE